MALSVQDASISSTWNAKSSWKFRRSQGRSAPGAPARAARRSARHACSGPIQGSSASRAAAASSPSRSLPSSFLSASTSISSSSTAISMPMRCAIVAAATPSICRRKSSTQTPPTLYAFPPLRRAHG